MKKYDEKYCAINIGGADVQKIIRKAMLVVNMCKGTKDGLRKYFPFCKDLHLDITRNYIFINMGRLSKGSIHVHKISKGIFKKPLYVYGDAPTTAHISYPYRRKKTL